MFDNPLVESTEVGWSQSISGVKVDYITLWAVGESALDVGAGRGWYSLLLAEQGYQVTALDHNPRFEDPRVRLITGEIEAPLPFPDRAFDTVLMFDILEHLADEDGIMREVARITSRRLIVSVPHADDGFLPQYALTYRHRVDRTHVREYTPESVVETMERYGFRTLHVSLEGLPHIPLVFSEFVRGPRWVKTLARYGITALYKLGLVYNRTIAGDVYWVGERVRESGT